MDTPDFKLLADAWEKGDVNAMLPWCEVMATGTYQGLTPHTVLVMETTVYRGIMDELVDRRWQAQRRQEDMAARAEGYRDVRHALASLMTMPAELATPIYLRIFP